MVCAPASQPVAGDLETLPGATSQGKIAAYLVERNYRELGCNDWDSRRVSVLCAKFGETFEVMAARLRLRPGVFSERAKLNTWTKQDMLIFTLLEREIDHLKGEKILTGGLVRISNGPPA